MADRWRQVIRSRRLEDGSSGRSPRCWRCWHRRPATPVRAEVSSPSARRVDRVWSRFSNDDVHLKNPTIKRNAPEFPVPLIRSKTRKGFRRELSDAKAAKAEGTDHGEFHASSTTAQPKPQADPRKRLDP